MAPADAARRGTRVAAAGRSGERTAWPWPASVRAREVERTGGRRQRPRRGRRPASARRPMSRPDVAPVEADPTDRVVGARDRARVGRRPWPRRSGRVRRRSPGRRRAAAVPAWNTRTSAQRRPPARCRRSACPARRAPGSRPTPARRHRARVGQRQRRRDRASSPAAAARQQRPRGLPRSSGSTTCASGSPNRTLNSITFGPSAVSIRPDVEEAAERVPLGRACRRATGATIVAQDARRASAASTSGLGANAPMPPVFGPWSSSKARLWSCAEPSGARRARRRRARRTTPRRPSRNSSTTSVRPASPNGRVDHRPRRRRRSASARVVGDDDALAGGEAVGLEHHGQAERRSTAPRASSGVVRR